MAPLSRTVGLNLEIASGAFWTGASGFFVVATGGFVEASFLATIGSFTFAITDAFGGASFSFYNFWMSN